MKYQNIRNNIKQSGLDLLELGRGLEQGIINRDLAIAKQAGSEYLSKPSAVNVAIGVPLTAAAAGINSIDAAQDDISANEAASLLNTGRAYAIGAGIASGFAADGVATFLKRDEMLQAEAEEAKLRQALERLGVTDEELTESYNTYIENAANAVEDQLSPEKSKSPATKRERVQRAQELTNKSIPAAERKLAGIRNQRRSMGAGLTAAGLGIAGLAMAFRDRTPYSDVQSSPINGQPVVMPTVVPQYSADNVPPYVAETSWSGYYPGREYGA